MNTVSSGGASWTHPIQLPLFWMTWAVDAKTTVCAPCRWCGSTTGSIAPGAGPHFTKLLCAHGHFQDLVTSASAQEGAPVSGAVFHLIDPQKLLSGEDYGAGEVAAPPGVEPEPAGCILDANIGRYRVRFLCVLQRDHAGPPAFLTVWKPDRPKRLKPALLRKYRRSRRDFVSTVATQFGLAFTIIDRMDGAPRITGLVYEHGEVEPAVAVVH